METEGTDQTPLVSMVTTGTSNAMTDQSPAQQRLVPHLSKSEVNRLGDRGTALGFGVKLLTNLEELGSITTHSGAEFGWGRTSDLRVCSNLL